MDPRVLIRHEDEATTEGSTCGQRTRLISTGDGQARAWAHTVEMDESKAHFHKEATELYYVVEGGGTITLDGETWPLRRGSIVHIPPGVVHSTSGWMRVLVVGIPQIRDDDVYVPEHAGETEASA